MSALLSLVLFVADGKGTPVSAQAVVERAVNAQGGLDKLAQAEARRYRVKGDFGKGGGTFQGDGWEQPGGKARLALQLQENKQGMMMLVLDGTRGWMKVNGAIEALDADSLNTIHTSSYVDRVCGLVVLQSDRRYHLSVLGESTVKDKMAVGIKVELAGRPEVNLYFDKVTRFLLKASHRSLDRVTKREIVKETYMDDYRLVDPVQEEELALKKAGLPISGSAVLDYLRKLTPDTAARGRIQALVGQLGDNSFAKREKASAELLKWGIQAAAPLRRAASAADAEVVRRAEKCLAQLEQRPEAALAVACVRVTAARQPPGAVGVLLDYLPWAFDAAARREVQNALTVVSQREKDSDPVLERAWKDAGPLKRAAAAAALGRDGGVYRKGPGRRLFIDGLRLPHRITTYRDGQLDMECRTTHFEFFNRFDEALFSRP